MSRAGRHVWSMQGAGDQQPDSECDLWGMIGRALQAQMRSVNRFQTLLWGAGD